MPKKAWIGITIALVVALIAVLWFVKSPTDQAQNGATVRVGVILPLTGDAGVYGKALQNGIELARGEVPSNSYPRVSLVYEDDQGQATQAVSAVRKLINVEKVSAIIGGAMSSTAEAIIPICEQKQVVLISPTATKSSLSRMGRFFFRLWSPDDYDGKIMAETAYYKLGLRRVSILYINIAYGASITKVFEREFQKLGGTVISREGYNQGEKDFRTYLTKIRIANPEALYLPGYVAEVTQILKQAKEIGVKVKFLGVNSLYDPKLIEIAGEAAEGAVFTYPMFDPDSTDPSIERFVESYKAKYGSKPDVFAAQGYDSFRVLKKALNELDESKITGPMIHEALHSLGPYEGPGGNFTFDERGDVQKPLRLLTVRNGRFVGFKD